MAHVLAFVHANTGRTAVVLLCTAGFVWGLTRGISAGGPANRLNGVMLFPVHEFGTVSSGHVIRTSWSIQNTRRHPIKIDRVSTTPRTKLSVSRRRANPGESITATLVADTSDLIGMQEFRGEIMSARGESPMAFVAHGKIVAPYPRLLDLGENLRGRSELLTSLDLEALGRNTASDGKVVTRLAYDQSYLVVRTEPREGMIRVWVAAHPQAPYGRFEERIDVHTNDALMTVKSILVRGHVMERYCWEPGYISLGASGLPANERTLTLMSPYDERFSIRSISTNVRGLRFVYDQSARNRHQISVEVPTRLPEKVDGWAVAVTSTGTRVMVPVYGLRL